MRRPVGVLVLASVVGSFLLWWFSRDQSIQPREAPADLQSRENVYLPPDREEPHKRSERSILFSEASGVIRRDAEETLIGLSGRVTNLNAIPIPAARIQLRYTNHLQAVDPLEARRLLRERVLSPALMAQTDVAAQAVANEQGFYFVPMQALPIANYQVVASGDGLGAERKLWPWTGESEEIHFRLVPGGFMTGTVVNPVGRPVAGASVVALTQGDEGRGNWSGEPELVNRTESGAHGAFHMDVYPGSFQLQARAPGYAPSTPTGATSNSSGLKLVLMPGLTLEGRVEDSLGRPVSEASVSVWPENAMKHWREFKIAQSALRPAYGRCITSAQGEFLFDDLPEGQFGLLTQKETYQPQLTRVDLGGSRDSGHVTVSLTAGQVLEGRVVDAGQQPLAGALVAVVPSRPRKVPSRRSTDRHDLAAESSRKRLNHPIPITKATAALETNSDGHFRFDTLQTESYDLSAVADGFLPVRLDGLDPGSAVQPLTLVLGTGSSLQGRVVSSITRQGVADALLIIGRIGHRRMTRTDSEGRFRVGGLPEGEIDEVKVQAEGYGLMTLNNVEVAGGRTRLDLELEPAAKVSGTVRDAVGQPVGGAWVHIQPAREASELEVAEDEWVQVHLRYKLSVQGQTDATGYFSIENVNPVSSLEIWVRHPAYGVLYGQPFPATPGEQISGLQLAFQQSGWK